MIETFEVDGVPVLLARRPGASTAGLMFRVGMVDETLPTRGITHLIEHLALSGPSPTGLSTNGVTSRLTTTFLAQGPMDRIADFLTGVCRQLGDLPIARLDAERAVLRTEEAGRRSGSPLSLWRYGSVRHGMLGYAELGRDQVGPEQVLGWARQNFTAENAALWIGLDPDDELPTLSLPLPRGGRRGVPSLATTALRGLPAFFASGRGGIAFDALVPRTTVSTVLARSLQIHLFQVLRTEAAVSYAVSVSYDPVDADWAEITVSADCLDENEGALVGLVVDQVAALAVGRIDPDAVARARTEGLEALADEDYETGAVGAYARDLLLGHQREDIPTLVAELEATDLESVQRAAAAFAAGVLVQVPNGQEPDWGGWEPAPRWSDRAVEGTPYPGRPGTEQTLVVGPEGLSLVFDEGASTVRFDQAVVWSVWPDGARAMTGADGFQVMIEPTLVDLPPGLLADLDRRVPPALVLHRPPRDPQSIPQPDPAEPGAKRRFWQRKR